MNQIIIVDDERGALHDLRAIVEECCPDSVITEFLYADEALRFVAENMVDLAFLDIEMPEISGLSLAAKIKDNRPRAKIVFVTGHERYALDAYAIPAGGYIVKPATVERVNLVLKELKTPLAESRARVCVQTFGNFEVFVDNQPMRFERSKTKELFAYLIDRRGARSTLNEIIAALWEYSLDTKKSMNLLRNLIRDLTRALKEAGIPNALIKARGYLAIDTKAVECDLYKFLAGDDAIKNAFRGEYMEQFSWAELTKGILD